MLGAALVCAAPATAAQIPTVPGYDSITLSAIPSNAQVIGCYTAGSWPTCDAVARDFPHAMRLTIAVQANILTYHGQPIDCLDVEPGDATNAQAPAWNAAEIRLGEKHPCDYTSESMMPSLHAAVAGQPVLFWDAAYDGDPTLRGFDAHQWTDTALGRNLDADTFSVNFLEELGLMATPDPQHYAFYPANAPAKPNRERQSVESWDAHKCENPVHRQVCRITRKHLLHDLHRDQRLYARDSKSRRDELHLPGRIQGLVHRITGKGVVRTWL